MPKQEKVERVAALKERIERSDALLLTEYRGLTVSDISSLRTALREGGASFAVIKNTLMRRAADDAAIAELESLLEGPTAVAFVEGDAVAAAKKVVEAQKKHPTLVLKGAYMDGRVLSADEAKSLADLESREVMLSKIAGLLKGEMSRAASMFVSLPSRFLGLLEAYAQELPAGADASEAPAGEPEGATEAPSADPDTEAEPAADTDTAASGDETDTATTQDDTDTATTEEE